jgi:hypothetical protein
MKIIDLRKPRTGKVLCTTKLNSYYVDWHYGETDFLTAINRKEMFYGRPRYKVVK